MRRIVHITYSLPHQFSSVQHICQLQRNTTRGNKISNPGSYLFLPRYCAFECFRRIEQSFYERYISPLQNLLLRAKIPALNNRNVDASLGSQLLLSPWQKAECQAIKEKARSESKARTRQRKTKYQILVRAFSRSSISA